MHCGSTAAVQATVFYNYLSWPFPFAFPNSAGFEDVVLVECIQNE